MTVVAQDHHAERKEWPRGLYKHGEGPKLYEGDMPEAGPVTVTQTDTHEPVLVGIGAIWRGKYGDCARCGQPLAGRRVRSVVYRHGPNRVVHASCVSTAEWLDTINNGGLVDPRRAL